MESPRLPRQWIRAAIGFTFSIACRRPFHSSILRLGLGATIRSAFLDRDSHQIIVHMTTNVPTVWAIKGGVDDDARIAYYYSPLDRSLFTFRVGGRLVYIQGMFETLFKSAGI